MPGSRFLLGLFVAGACYLTVAAYPPDLYADTCGGISCAANAWSQENFPPVPGETPGGCLYHFHQVRACGASGQACQPTMRPHTVPESNKIYLESVTPYEGEENIWCVLVQTDFELDWGEAFTMTWVFDIPGFTCTVRKRVSCP